MRVTHIEPARHAGRLNVFVDGELLLSVSREVAEERGLREGATLDAASVDELQNEDAFQDAFDGALRFLAARPRSEQEVRQSLAKKGVAESLHDSVVEKLRRLGYVDDAAFARYWIENRERFRPRGQRLLKSELRQKGVGAGAIEETLAETVDEEASALDAANKYARRLRHLDYPTFRQRLWAHLARRGFDFEAIHPAIEAAWRQMHADESSSESPPESSPESSPDVQNE